MKRSEDTAFNVPTVTHRLTANLAAIHDSSSTTTSATWARGLYSTRWQTTCMCEQVFRNNQLWRWCFDRTCVTFELQTVSHDCDVVVGGGDTCNVHSCRMRVAVATCLLLLSSLYSALHTELKKFPVRGRQAEVCSPPAGLAETRIGSLWRRSPF